MTSPEELLAGAQAACFSMALANVLASGGHDPQRIETDAACRFEPLAGGGFGITSMDIDVRVRVSGMEQTEFDAAISEAEAGCPVSNALRGNVEVDLHAELVS